MEDQKYGNLWEGQKTLLDNIRSGVPLIFAINADISSVNMYSTFQKLNIFVILILIRSTIHLKVYIYFARLSSVFVANVFRMEYSENVSARRITKILCGRKNCYITIHIDKSIFKFLLLINTF
jgi:hypothetical protein